MTIDQKQKMALFRYSVIAPLVTGAWEPWRSKNEFYRQASKKTYIGPDGKEKNVCTSWP